MEITIGTAKQSVDISWKDLVRSNWITDSSRKVDFAVYKPGFSGRELVKVLNEATGDIKIQQLSGVEGAWSIYWFTTSYK